VQPVMDLVGILSRGRKGRGSPRWRFRTVFPAQEMVELLNGGRGGGVVYILMGEGMNRRLWTSEVYIILLWKSFT
jgi:hypothetical protein